jgi:phosphatidylglycerophosphate synthase
MNGQTEYVSIVADLEQRTRHEVEFRDAVRLQGSITAPAERKVLAWFAEKLPLWIHPDHLTAIGLMSMLLAGASYASARWHRSGLILASIFIVLNWFGDSLDGTLARIRQCQRPRYGFYVDHVIDTVGTFFLMGGLALSGYLNWPIALGMYISFLVLAIESYLAAYALRTFRLSCGKFGPTEIRILLILGNAALWLHADVRMAGTPYRLFDAGGVIAIGVMTVMFFVLSVQNTVRLYREESFTRLGGPHETQS